MTEDTFGDVIPLEGHVVQSSDGTWVPLFPGAEEVPVTFQNRDAYVRQAMRFRLTEFDAQMEAVRRGLAEIVPLPLLLLFSPSTLEHLVCGDPTIDISFLRAIVRYRDVEPTDTVIVWLWEVLEDFSGEERSQFLRFVSGRTRLPASTSDIAQRFQVCFRRAMCESLLLVGHFAHRSFCPFLSRR